MAISSKIGVALGKTIVFAGESAWRVSVATGGALGEVYEAASDTIEQDWKLVETRQALREQKGAEMLAASKAARKAAYLEAQAALAVAAPVLVPAPSGKQKAVA